MALIDRLASQVTARPGGKVLPEIADLPADFITGTVTARDRMPERIRASQPGMVHVSSLGSFCGRQLILLRREERPMVRSVTGGHRIMWRFGRAVEAHIREQFIEGRNRAGILGRWTCRCGTAQHVGRYNATMVCSECNGHLNIYGEYTLSDTEARLIGNPDLLVEHEGAVVTVEIKSMNAADWDKLKAPMGEHIFQAGMYYDLGLVNKLRMHRSAVFVYCTKDFKWGNPYKEFHTNVATPSLLAQRESVRQSVQEALRHEGTDSLPTRTICASPNAGMAKVCPVATACFNWN